MALLTEKQIKDLGLKVGKGVMISDKASFYGASNIVIGDNVRIDDFVVLSAGVGGIEIGSHVHIAVYTSLIGAGKITIGNFVNISSKVSIYSSNDDYTGKTMTNPLIPDNYKNIYSADVKIGEHTVIGCGTVILPGSEIGSSCSLGAMSFVPVDSKLERGKIYVGCPVRAIKNRDLGHLALAKKFLKEYKKA